MKGFFEVATAMFGGLCIGLIAAAIVIAAFITIADHDKPVRCKPASTEHAA